MNKNIIEMAQEEITKLCFEPPKLTNHEKLELEKEKARFKRIGKKDKTYKNYPAVNILTRKVIGYPFKGFTNKKLKTL